MECIGICLPYPFLGDSDVCQAGWCRKQLIGVCLMVPYLPVCRYQQKRYAYPPMVVTAIKKPCHCPIYGEMTRVFSHGTLPRLQEIIKQLHLMGHNLIRFPDQSALQLHLLIRKGHQHNLRTSEVPHGVGRSHGNRQTQFAQLIAHAHAVGFKNHLRLESGSPALLNTSWCRWNSRFCRANS